MSKGRNLPTAIVTAIALLVCSGQAAAAPPAYYPPGPQTFVSRDALTGWTLCWSSTYDSADADIATVLAGCPGDYMMLAGGATGSPTWDVLAAAPRADVLFDTHNSDADITTTHTANGSDWYYGANWAWGFLKAGDPRQLWQCDTEFWTNPQLRLCWHTGAGGAYTAGAINPGYRAGEQIAFFPEFERAIYVANGTPDPPPPPPGDTGGPTAGHVTGGGFVVQGGEKVTFAVNARSDARKLDGMCVANARVANLRCLTVDGFRQTGDHVVITGDALHNRTPTRYRIEVVDGVTDQVDIRTDSGFAAAGVVVAGNVRIDS